MLADLRAFLFRGNVFELAVAFVLGAAFNAVVSTFSSQILLGLIGALFGRPNFDDLVLTVGDSRIAYGLFLTAVTNFLLIGTGLFFLIRAVARFEPPEQSPPTPDREDVVLLREIRDLLRAASL